MRHEKQTGVEVTAVSIKHDLVNVLAAKGLSRAECARRLRVSSRTFERIMAGGVPKLDVALSLEVVLDTPLKDIFIAKVHTRSVR